MQFKVHVALLTASGLLGMDDCRNMEEFLMGSGWKDADPEHGSVYWAAGAEMLKSYVPELLRMIGYVRAQYQASSFGLPNAIALAVCSPISMGNAM